MPGAYGGLRLAARGAGRPLVLAWVRDTSGSEDRRQVDLLRLLLKKTTFHRPDPVRLLLLARELVFLGEGTFPAKEDRLYTYQRCLESLLEAPAGELRDHGYEVAHRLAQVALPFCLAEKPPPDTSVTQSAFLAALIDDPRRQEGFRDYMHAQYLRFRYLLGKAEFRLGRRAEAARTLRGLLGALRAATPARSEGLNEYRRDMVSLLRDLGLAEEALELELG